MTLRFKESWTCVARQPPVGRQLRARHQAWGQTWLATHLSPRALTSFASLRKSKICGLTSSIKARQSLASLTPLWGVLPSAKRPEGRAARGRPGNVWQFSDRLITYCILARALNSRRASPVKYFVYQYYSRVS